MSTNNGQKTASPCIPDAELRLLRMRMNYNGKKGLVTEAELALAWKDRTVFLSVEDGEVAGSATEGGQEIAYGEWELQRGLGMPGSLSAMEGMARNLLLPL